MKQKALPSNKIQINGSPLFLLIILVVVTTVVYQVRQIGNDTLREVACGFGVVAIVLVAMGIFLWSVRWGLLQDEKRTAQSSADPLPRA